MSNDNNQKKSFDERIALLKDYQFEAIEAVIIQFEKENKLAAFASDFVFDVCEFNDVKQARAE